MSGGRIDSPELDPALGPNPAPQASLVEQLGPVADSIRQIATDLGARPYRVFSVRYRWSGGAIGNGVPERITEIELLPTPKVAFEQLPVELRTAGNVERGGFVLRQISPRYTEDQLTELGYSTDPGVEAFVEVSLDARDSDPSKRRRFAKAGVPWYDAERFQWSVRLTRQDSDRSRSGAPWLPRMRDEP